MEVDHRIEEIEFPDGDRVLLINLPIIPFGAADFLTDGWEEPSKLLLREVASNWNELWPEMLERLQDGIAGYELDVRLGSDEFVGDVSRMESGIYMSDQSDIFIRLEFEEPPLWDYFIKGSKIVHFQPVF